MMKCNVCSTPLVGSGTALECPVCTKRKEYFPFLEPIDQCEKAPVSEWISTKERVPTLYTKVLFCYKNSETVYVGEYITSGFQTKSKKGDYMVGKAMVDYWQERPTPPQE